MLQVSIATGALDVLKGIDKASNKLAAWTANDTAFAARGVMGKTSESLGDRLRLVRIKKATSARLEAVIRDRGWGRMPLLLWAYPAGMSKVRAPLVLRGGADQVLVPARKELATRGSRNIRDSLATGFVGVMQSGKAGIWKRYSKARTPIDLLYSIRPGAEVDKVLAAGREAARIESVHSFRKAFKRILNDAVN